MLKEFLLSGVVAGGVAVSSPVKQELPGCFMIDQNNNIVRLDHICGRRSQPSFTSQPVSQPDFNLSQPETIEDYREERGSLDYYRSDQTFTNCIGSDEQCQQYKK